MKYIYWKVALVCTVVLIAFGIGFSIGAAQSLNLCINTGLKLLKLNNLELEIDKTFIVAGLNYLKYHNEREISGLAGTLYRYNLSDSGGNYSITQWD